MGCHSGQGARALTPAERGVVGWAARGALAGLAGGRVPILPLIDLLLLLGTGRLFVGFMLKAIAITTSYRPHILGFTSIDFVLIAGVCMGMALVLAARTWVKLNEPRLLAMRREGLEEQFRREQRLLERAAAELDDEAAAVEVQRPLRTQRPREVAGDRG